MSQEATAQNISNNIEEPVPGDVEEPAKTAETSNTELPPTEAENLEGIEEVSNEILETDPNEEAAENAIKQANEEFRQTAKIINEGETTIRDYAQQSDENIPEESISAFKKLQGSGEKLLKGFLQLFKKKPELTDVNSETELEGLLELDLDLTKNPEPSVVRSHVKAIDKKIAVLKIQQNTNAGEELSQRNLKYEIIAYEKRRQDLEDYLNFRIQTPKSIKKEVKPVLADDEEEEPTLEDLGIAKKSIFRRPQKITRPKTTKGEIDTEEVSANPTMETEKVKVDTGYERLVKHEEAAINFDLEAVKLEATYAANRRAGIEALIKAKNIDGLIESVQKMQIIWTNLAEARSNFAHSRQERVLYKKALRGDAIIVDQPSTLDLIIRDINRAKQAVDSLRAGLEPAQVEEEALAKSAEDAWWDEKVGTLAGAPEIIPTLEEKKAEVVKLEEEKTEVVQAVIEPEKIEEEKEEESKEIYEAIIPKELENLNKTALKKIEERMRELDRLAGSREMREKQNISQRQIENEMRLLIDQQKELLHQNIPDEIVKAEIESLEKEIQNLPKELKKYPETLSEETERLKEQQKVLADYLERGYDLELVEMEIEAEDIPEVKKETTKTEGFEVIEVVNTPEKVEEKDPSLQIIERFSNETYNTYNRRSVEISKLLEFDDNTIIESGTTRKALETELEANKKIKAELENGKIPADLIKDKIKELTEQIEFVLDITLPDAPLTSKEVEKMHATNKKQAEKLQAEKKVFVDYLKREKPQTTTSETVPIVGIEQAPSYQADKEEFINLKSELAFLEMDKSPSVETNKKKGELAKKIRKIDFWKRYRDIAERERTLVTEAIVDKAMELKKGGKKPPAPETAASSVV